MVRKIKSKQRGFTLVELLTTLTVAGIGLSIAVPGFNTVVNNGRRATGISQMLTTMHLVRSEAVTRNSQVTVCPSTTGNSCAAIPWHYGWIGFVDLNSNRSVDNGETVLLAIDGMEHLDINSPQFNTFFAYRPNGRLMINTPAQNTGSFTICDPRGSDHARIIEVDTSGMPRTREQHKDGSSPVCPA